MLAVDAAGGTGVQVRTEEKSDGARPPEPDAAPATEGGVAVFHEGTETGLGSASDPPLAQISRHHALPKGARSFDTVMVGS